MEENVFIDFSIIQNSDLQELKSEFDKLIIAGKKIFIWSKKALPSEMSRFCKNIKIQRDPEEINLHKEVLASRAKRNSYKDIADDLDIDIGKVSYFANIRLFEEWNLDDWIIDYYKKDSSIYPKVDFVIDPDQKVVDRFARNGVNGNVVDKL